MEALARKPYPSDLTDEQWELIELVIPAGKHGGRPRAADMREVINAMLHIDRSGCQWDMLPHDFPPKSTVYEYFAAWREDGTTQRILDVLREAYRHVHAPSEEPTPSAVQHRQPDGQDNGARRRARLRWRQENQGPQAAYRGRYAGPAPGGRGHQRRRG